MSCSVGNSKCGLVHVSWEALALLMAHFARSRCNAMEQVQRDGNIKLLH